MPVTVDSKLQSLKTVIKHEFNNAYGKLSPDSFYNKVCTQIASNSASNTYDLLGDFPEFKEWTSARQVKDMKENALLLFIHNWSEQTVLERNQGLVLSEFGKAEF